MPGGTTVRRLPSFGVQVLIAMVAGLALGLAARALGPAAGGGPNALAQTLDVVGSIFVQLLKALVPPLVFTALVASIANLKDISNAAALVGRTLLWFAATALIAVAIGMTLGFLLQPGSGAGSIATAPRAHAVGSWLDFLKGVVPENAFGLALVTKYSDAGIASTKLDFHILQIVVIAIITGIAALQVGDAGTPFLNVVRSALAIVKRLLRWLIKLTPIGTIGLFGTAVAQYGWSTLAQLSQFAAAVYIGLAIVLLVVYPAILIAHRLDPRHFFATAWPAIQLGFVSRSSIGTLPLTELAAERLGVPRAYAAFAVPLASTTKMDGCAAIYPAVAAIFVAQFYGIPIGVTDCILIAVVSVLGSAATAGLTGAIVMLTLTLSTLGLPLEGVGLLLAIDPIIDMGRTAVNVAGQALIPTIVAREEGILDLAAYDRTGGGDLTAEGPQQA